MKRKSGTRGSPRGCLLLMGLALLFIVAVYAIMIGCMTLLQNHNTESNAREAIRQCQQASRPGSGRSVAGYFNDEGCAEMQKQFVARFHHQP